jgi:hypothetical protein
MPRLTPLAPLAPLVLLVLVGGAGCSHAPPGPELRRDPVLPAVAPLSTAALPAAVAEARQQLLHFREHDVKTLEAARQVLETFETPERFEERGVAEGRSYYYAKEVHHTVGIVVHLDGDQISNVEVLSGDHGAGAQ